MSEFNGVWIEKDIFLIKDLKIMDKHILSEARSLSKATGYCFASNAYFGQLYDLSNGRVSQIITKLKNAGFLSTKMKIKNKAVEMRLIFVDHEAIKKAVKRELEGIKNIKYPLFNKLKGGIKNTKGGIKNIKGGYLENDSGNSKEINSKEEQLNNNIIETPKTKKGFTEQDYFVDGVPLYKKANEVFLNYLKENQADNLNDILKKHKITRVEFENIISKVFESKTAKIWELQDVISKPYKYVGKAEYWVRNEATFSPKKKPTNKGKTWKENQNDIANIDWAKIYNSGNKKI